MKSLSIPYEKDLNPQQLEAVFYMDSPLLVLAGAGSGKTRVITYKVAYMINELSFDPNNMLAVTFTNKASNEMKERVEHLLGEETPLWVKTFHSTAAKLLRIMGKEFGVNNHFSIIDQQDQLSMLKNIVKEMNLDTETYKPEKYAYLINRSKDRLLDAEEAVTSDFSTDPVFYDIYNEYEKRMSAQDLLDFGDLLCKLVKGLLKNEVALDHLKKKYRYILVDEFQDTNYAQYMLIRLLTHPEGEVCVVGDDDQSIYGFRGAQVENILNFPKDYLNTKIIKLEQNYRSYQTILSASSSLIDKNPGRLGKTLYTEKGEGEKLYFYRASTDYNEALFIADQIRKLIYKHSYSYSDMAVFYRTNAQSRVFESIFSQMHIPFTIIGGFRFYEREEIKDILAYLKLALNPMDEISFRRIANKPPRGIGPKTVDALVSASIQKGYTIYVDGRNIPLPPSRKKNIEYFLNTIKAIGEMVHNATPPQLLRYLYEQTGYPEWLKNNSREEKVANLDELYNAVEEFSWRNPAAHITEFVEEVSLDQGGGGGNFAENGVFLITLHNAKGLEFPVVFMAGMEEGIFPHYLSGGTPSDMYEERRLCYVGMTRAMEKLYLTAARVRMLYGRSVERGISKFVLEIPRELLVSSEDVDTFSGYFYPAEKHHRKNLQDLNFKKRTTQASEKVDTESDIQVNSRIMHRHYGRGEVVEVERGVALIQFDDGRRMRFMLKFTPITKEE
jgi:DNA helicase-2/ATP-dependent DNA helicase PcrA